MPAHRICPWLAFWRRLAAGFRLAADVSARRALWPGWDAAPEPWGWRRVAGVMAEQPMAAFMTAAAAWGGEADG